MDKLRSNVNLVQYSQKNPYQVYTEEGTKLFESMLDDIAYEVMISIFKDRRGRKSLITKEMKNDPLFQNIVNTNVIDNTMQIDEIEKLLVEKYQNIKRRVQEIMKEEEEKKKNNINENSL
ncbi:preprotein translocase subunit SecA [Mycoplasmopsis edwardii]|uniref:Preprotein translocase subunit SecA n=4 Tax=Mycoplasmopsis edwardii TaxID=53558 RepID=A0A3B0QD66_9BACT|nr:preprotein translocase subunit SecA [Mycoplasmopsis edwardii]